MNTWQFTPYALLYILVVVISYVLSYLAWKTRPVRGATYFSLLTLAIGTWTLGHLLGFFNTDLSWRLIMLRVEYLGILSSHFLWLVFAATYTQFDRWLTHRVLALLAILPVITFILILTIQQHNLFYRSFELTTEYDLVVSIKVYGPGFYVSAVYGYFLILAGTVILFRGVLRMPERFQRQGYLLVLATAVILFFNILYLSGNNPIPPYDPTPLSFGLASVFLMLAMRRYKFLDIVPVAHNLIFKHTNSGVIIIDHRERIQDMNLAAEHILNRSSEVALGKSIFDIFPEYTNLIKRIWDMPKIKTEIKIEQDMRSYELQITPLIDHTGKSMGRIFTFYDLTERKLAEQQHLELVMERERMQILSNFITQASHEFRTPLSVINTSTYMLKQLDDPTLRQRHIGQIEDQIKNIATLVDNLTTLAKLDSIKELTTEEVDLYQMMVAVNATKQSTYQLKNIRSSVELKTQSLLVQVDIDYLQQAIETILDNAIHFTPEGSTITVCVDSRDDNAIIEIADTGDGISDDDISHIFERFYRADKAGTTRGFGLGLPIAKAIIKLHQGSIEVESEAGKGSIFRILLPMAQSGYSNIIPSPKIILDEIG